MITRHDLELEIKRKNFVRAVRIAWSLSLSEDTIKELQFEALWRMAVPYRNPSGLKILSQEYGVQKQELKKLLEDRVKQAIENGNTKSLASCFDITTGKYFTLEEWVEYHTGSWKDYR